MTFHQLMREDYSFKSYEYFKSMLAVQNKLPIHCTRIDNNDSYTLFIFLLENNRGMINTKRIRMTSADAVFFSSFVAQDFPKLDLQYIDKTMQKNVSSENGVH